MTKKRKRQGDFQKTKLKVGQKKPKADNATDVNFRSKTIHLPEQLKHGDSGPTTHRHLNIKVHKMQSLTLSTDSHLSGVNYRGTSYGIDASIRCMGWVS